MYPTPRSHRPLIMGRNGAVGANHPMAAQAGIDILRAGGNAVDASVAVALALGVCEPMMSGLGGDGFYHVFMAGKGEATVFNGSGPAPKAATPERYRGGIPIDGPLSVSVPGGLAAIALMHERHGRRSWAQLVEPAILLAADGFAATHSYRCFASENRGRLAADPHCAKVFLDHPLADLIVQPELARTLEEIATDGAETLYRGKLAQRLARGMRDAGILVAEEDLAAFAAEVQAPIAIAYRGFEVRQTPPNSTGFVMLEMLKIVERFDLKKLSATERVHVLVEAKKLAFHDRESYGCDPRFDTVPLDHLLSDHHASELAARIDLNRARRAEPQPIAVGDTTYFCVIDSEGNAVSGIQSINSAFGW